VLSEFPVIDRRRRRSCTRAHRR